MRIKAMTAVFGGLERARLELGPGLNLIHAPNEGGKSTWCAFWRAMLYGIDTRDRDRKGHLADKNRWQPWSGAPMSGEITLEWQGREITIRRFPRGNVPFGGFSAVYAGTQEPVPGLSASCCGELLTGVGQEVFTRSAFLGGGDLAVTAAPELERRIAALVTSGQEDVSFSQAMERLKIWKNRRQVNRSVGEIPRLEGELAQTEEALARLEELSARIAQWEGERTRLERQAAQASRQVQEEHARRLEEAREECRQARRQLEALEARPLPGLEELKEAQGELQYLRVLDEELRQGTAALEEAQSAAAQAKEEARDGRFPEMTGEEAVAKAAAVCTEYRTAQEKGRRYQRTCLWSVILGLIWLLGFSIPLLLKNGVNFFSGLGAGLCVFCLLLAFVQKGRVKKLQNGASGILAQYGVQTPEELEALAQDYQARCQAADKAVHRVEVIRAAVVERQVKREDARTALLRFVHQFAPEVRDLYGCSAALSRALNQERDLALLRQREEHSRRRLEDLSGQSAAPAGEEQAARRLEQVNARLNQAYGSLHTMDDPAALAAKKEELEQALARRRLELEALELASDVLTQANALLQERFSPQLNALAGEYLAKLTGNKYQSLTLSRELEGFVRTQRDVLPRSALYLSRGTADQLYLALRLAVCRLCLPERPPIVLDDALTAFDDRRLALALELLKELAEGQQVILFTCQKREGELLSHTPGVRNIELSKTG